MSTDWLHATTQIPTVTLISLAGWAALATVLGGWHWLTYHRRPGRIDAPAAESVRWDDEPATAAEPGRDGMRAAS